MMVPIHWNVSPMKACLSCLLLYLRAGAMPGTHRSSLVVFQWMLNDDDRIGPLPGLNKEMHIKCLAEHLALVEHKTNVANYCY